MNRLKFGDNVDHQYKSSSQNLICSDHIEDEYIKNYILDDGMDGICSYCNKHGKITKLSRLLDLIDVGINCLFDDATEIRYLNEDGEHGLDGDTLLLYDIIYEDHLGLHIDNTQLLDDIHENLDRDIIYCRKDEFGNLADDYTDLWDYFKFVVKHEARFVYYFKEQFSGHFYLHPINVLEKVQETIIELDLFTIINSEEKLYRCRQHVEKNKIDRGGKEITSTPLNKSKSNNRLSPAGISMFYCSPHKDISISETVDFKNKEKPFYTTVYFTTKNDFKLVDLTNFPELPNIFDEQNNHLRDIIIFLDNFVKDITKPILKSDEIIDYVPTQVITEYIKFNKKIDADGIIYPSSKDNTKENYVLFLNHEESFEKLDFHSESIEINQI